MLLSAPIIWFALGILFFALEILVPAGAFLFFGLGCLAGWLAALFDLAMALQVLLATIVCILSLLCLRRRLRGIFSGESGETASSALIGRQGEVTGAIVPGREGQVSLAGSYWRAVAAGESLEEGTLVEVTGVAAHDALLLQVRRVYNKEA